MRDLKDTRKEIDEIDAAITELYLRRLGLARDVAEYKLSKHLPVFDPKREEEKLESLSKAGKDAFSKNGIKELFSQIMSGNRKKQYAIMAETKNDDDFGFLSFDNIDFSDKKICFQGVKGSYSEKAACAFFGEEADMHSVFTWRDALDQLVSKEADFAVLPIENSSAGTVNEIFDLLSEYPVSVIGQKTIKIDHSLLGMTDAALADIDVVYSHPQALMQCSSFLEGHPGIDAVSVKNTAIAARRVMEEGDKKKAAIGDSSNAKIYGLKILKQSIQNDKTNETRFLIVSGKKIFLKGADTITVSFEIQNDTGSLYHSLSNFTYNGLNMTHIVSRPIFGRPWEYRFFVDFEGNIEDEAVKNALYCLKQETGKLKILGNYVRS